ncbi:putative RNA methyltransferase [Mycetocola zhujimingii]|uniref:putative RNA methyltransferase n=1 Tax=Mycetocola zhujimingii TaxID=2079792 RepID=UPI0030012CE7
MTLRHLAEGLRCPFCFSQRAEERRLSPVDHLVIGCDAGHRFDVNKRGYVSLLPASTRVTGDSQQMLDARARFFETGAFDPIADAVASATVDAWASRTTDPTAPAAAGADAPWLPRIAELGCGTGFYLSRAVAGLTGAGSNDILPVAADLSPFAVRMAVRAVGSAGGVVLDVWQPLPFLSESVAGILSVFAPRNLPEFARVLDAGGFLVAVVPTTRHLQEIRAEGRAIGIPDGKPEALTDAASPWFSEENRALVEFEMQLTSVELDALIGMGPSAHHTESPTSTAEQPGVARHDSETPDAAQAESRRVTASVTVLTYRRRPAVEASDTA